MDKIHIAADNVSEAIRTDLQDLLYLIESEMNSNQEDYKKQRRIAEELCNTIISRSGNNWSEDWGIA